jgi:hypothetical protein
VLEIELEILLDEPQALALGSQNHSHVRVDALLKVESWLVYLAHIPSDSCQGFYPSLEVESLPPLRDAIRRPCLDDSLSHEILVYRTYEAVA